MTVFSFGEALVDMLSGQVIDNDPAAPFCYYPVAGGAPANVAVAVAKLGCASEFVGGIATDVFGTYVLDALNSHGVGTRFAQRPVAGKTALAFVSLDSTGERSFSFYGEGAAHLDFDAAAFDVTVLDSESVFHFGSNTLTGNPARAATETLVAAARQRRATVSFDINFRHGLWDTPADAPAVIDALAAGSQVIKASREELSELYGSAGATDMPAAWLSAGAALVVVTDGGRDIEFFTAAERDTIAVPDVTVVDTTAAGDAFVGGLLSALAAAAPRDAVEWATDTAKVREALRFASRCGAFATTRAGAFPSLPGKSDVMMDR